MNKQISAFLSATLLAFVATSMADSTPEASAQDTKKMVQNNFVETAKKGIKLSGYVDTGYSYNFTGAANGNSDVRGRFGSDTAAKGDFNLYAVKIALEKALTSENKAQAGFRTDVMIGEDANYLINRYNTVVTGHRTLIKTQMPFSSSRPTFRSAPLLVTVGTSKLASSFRSLAMK